MQHTGRNQLYFLLGRNFPKLPVFSGKRWYFPVSTDIETETKSEVQGTGLTKTVRTDRYETVLTTLKLTASSTNVSSRIDPISSFYPLLLLFRWREREMSTLPFSLGSCNPRKLIVIRNLHTSEESPTSSIKFSSHIIHNETTSCSPVLLKLNQRNPIVLVKRREAISVGLCSGILGVILQQSKVSAAEASSTTTPSPCELTQAPSGLAYCDKVVGYGPEAVKGQLIKVTNSESIFPLYMLGSVWIGSRI